MFKKLISEQHGCVYCGKELHGAHPNVMACCKEVGHVITKRRLTMFKAQMAYLMFLLGVLLVITLIVGVQ